jgi:hypothetical protein
MGARMISSLPALAAAVVRAWTRLYTWRVHPHDARDRRRAEIESDLWESMEETDTGLRRSVQILARMVRGMPDDLWWRGDQCLEHPRWQRATGIALLALGVFTAWVLNGLRTDVLPEPRGASQFERVYMPSLPPPPPPPPPPCRPGSIGCEP